MTSHLQIVVIWKSWKDPHSREAICLFEMWQDILLEWHFEREWKTPFACSKCDQSFTDSGELKIMKGSTQLNWVLSWYIKPFDDVNVLSHVEQVNDFSPVCVLLCCFKTFDIVNDLSHFEQLNGLFPLSVLLRHNKPFEGVNVLSHAEQVNDFSEVCVLSWCFKLVWMK